MGTPEPAVEPVERRSHRRVRRHRRLGDLPLGALGVRDRRLGDRPGQPATVHGRDAFPPTSSGGCGCRVTCSPPRSGWPRVRWRPRAPGDPPSRAPAALRPGHRAGGGAGRGGAGAGWPRRAVAALHRFWPAALGVVVVLSFTRTPAAGRAHHRAGGRARRCDRRRRTPARYACAAGRGWRPGSVSWRRCR